MPWQQIMAGLIVVAAGIYVVWRFRRKKNQRRSQGPDVPVSRLTRKRPPPGSCGH
jgi:heme/copper-type cytochrome/quinol oxidase subunit 2